MSTTNERVRKETTTGPLTVSRVYASEWQKEGTLTAEIKQKVSTKSFYPSKVTSNSLQDNIFGTADFGFEEQEFENVETRVAWVDVPAGTTIEQVEAKLAAAPKARLYRILSNKPIIADTEQYAIDSPDLDVSLDTFANRQVVRFPENSENPGALATDQNGKVQYRRVAFSATGLADQDLRTSEPSDVYLSEELQAELQGSTAVTGQSL